MGMATDDFQLVLFRSACHNANLGSLSEFFTICEVFSLMAIPIGPLPLERSSAYTFIFLT
jgi:hypothetical protein